MGDIYYFIKIGEKMKNEKRKKLGIGAGISLGLIVGILVMANISTDVSNPAENVKEEEWHTVYVWTPTGENTPAGGAGGFMSIFLLDYGQVPATVLQTNGTDWENSANVHGYADTDSFNEDAVSDDPFYVVVRARFTEAEAKSGGDWDGSRCRVTLTASGDETISQTVVGNDTAETYGGGIESENNSNYDHIYINFYFDDNDDGYAINDDGSLTISEIKIEAKY